MGFNEVCAVTMENNGVKAVLFDLDNTLIETTKAGNVALQKVNLKVCLNT